jgi:hypothetical protein
VLAAKRAIADYLKLPPDKLDWINTLNKKDVIAQVCEEAI